MQYYRLLGIANHTYKMIVEPFMDAFLVKKKTAERSAVNVVSKHIYIIAS